MTSVYDQKTATEMYKRESFEEGRVEGVQQGIQQGMQKGKQQGMVAAFAEMVRDKILTVKEAAKRLGMTESEFLQLAK